MGYGHVSGQLNLKVSCKLTWKVMEGRKNCFAFELQDLPS